MFTPPKAPVLLYQDPTELGQLITLYQERKPMRVLEIGSAYGGTLYHWLSYAQQGAVIVSVDLHDPAFLHEGANYQLWPTWAPPGVTLHILTGDSKSYDVQTWAAAFGPYDFIFIDGDHSYNGAKSDWESYALVMSKRGAIVAFDDTKPNPTAAPPCEVSRLWAELQPLYKTDQYIGDALTLGNGIGVVYL